ARIGSRAVPADRAARCRMVRLPHHEVRRPGGFGRRAVGDIHRRRFERPPQGPGRRRRKMTNSPFLTRAVLKNYKSIEACDVDLDSLTFLVGPNGAGKSNFLDALRFVADALRTSLDHA